MAIWKTLSAVLLSFSIFMAPPAYAQCVPSSVNSPESIELAEILVTANSSESAVDHALVQMTDALFEQQPDLALLEDTYPGMRQVFLNAMRPIVDVEMKRIRPLYVDDLAMLFAANFSISELKTLSIFWQSPPAQAVLKSATQSTDYAAISTEVVAQINHDSDIVISQDAVDKDMRTAVKNTMNNAGKAEQSAFFRFAISPVGRKFVKLKNKKDAVDLKWMNAPMPPEVEKQIETVIMSALDNHISNHEKREAARPTT